MVATSAEQRPELADVAGRLEELAPSGPPGVALRLLAGTLRDGGGDVAGIDLVTAFPPDALLADDGDEKTYPLLRNTPLRNVSPSRYIAVVRDVLIFVPIFVTWAELWLALGAYQSSPRGTSFVQAWLTGFPGSSVPTLGTCAIFVALVVGVVIALTLWLGWRRSDRDARRLELSRELATATMLVATRETGERDPAVTDRQLRKFANDFQESAARLGEQMDAAARTITESMESGPGSRLHAAIDEWTQTAGQMRESWDSLRLPREALAELTRIATENERLHERLTTLLEQLDAAARSTRESGEANGELARQITVGLESIQERGIALADTMDILRRVVQELRDAGLALRAPAGPNGGGHGDRL